MGLFLADDLDEWKEPSDPEDIVGYGQPPVIEEAQEPLAVLENQ